ncbi:DUF6343 family protein [Solicola gregarius]|uniref:DUF6343 family protein n=1 Tax=Solicola gregarius TaxID=2908642 RepID=A0AA46TG19_9ACTN|nr:DUF6343 family protein [Solicola gregarius]UYM04651.1 DUF6343 family protein [Solicola gregarius]
MSARGFDNPFGDRSGREPVSARSPLRLRLVLSLVGATGFAALAVVALIVQGAVWLPVVAVALAAVGLADAVVITHRLGDRGD